MTEGQVNKPGNKGVKRIVKATGYSMLGFKAAYKHEEAFRQELYLVILMTPLAFYLGDSAIERSLMIGSLMLVLIAELLNSAIEALVDRVGIELHILSGRAKDIGSAAVFVSLTNVVVIWGLILIDKYY